MKEKLKKELEKNKKRLERALSRIAKKKPGSETDWEAQFPEMNIEVSEDLLEDSAKKREEYEVRRFLEQTLELKLKKVEEALKKIKKGEYGVCERCGKEIEQERLKAVPEAKYCKLCKN